MTQLLIKRSIHRLTVGDVLVRQSTGEKCRILDIITDNYPVRRFRFFGFDVMSPAMRRMFFDLKDETVEEYVPEAKTNYAMRHKKLFRLLTD